jgi:hypothetical protein
MFERSELFEPLGELSERSEKRKVSALARWGGPKGRRRSKQERINLKMLRSDSAGRRSTKRVPWKGFGKRNRGYRLSKAKSILLVFARAGS